MLTKVSLSESVSCCANKNVAKQKNNQTVFQFQTSKMQNQNSSKQISFGSPVKHILHALWHNARHFAIDAYRHYGTEIVKNPQEFRNGAKRFAKAITNDPFLSPRPAADEVFDIYMKKIEIKPDMTKNINQLFNKTV